MDLKSVNKSENQEIIKEIDIDINIKQEPSQKLGSIKSKDSKNKSNKAGVMPNKPPIHRHSLYNKIGGEIKKTERKAMSEVGHPSVPRVLSAKNNKLSSQGIFANPLLIIHG